MSRPEFERAIAAIDAENALDPHRIMVRGRERPKELAHAELASEWVGKLDPEPSEELRLAARGHHVRRWTRPRSDHPPGRAAYLRWRRELQEMHAECVGGILAAAGYPPARIARVAELITKRAPRGDPEAQALEDALCLVFLETQLHDLTGRMAPEKMVGVLVKSLRKMSDAGRREALELDYGEEDRRLLDRALTTLAAARPEAPPHRG